jgi:hypothetical protein
MALITYTMAAQELELYDLASDPVVEAKVRRKMAQAHALVMTHIKAHLWETPPTWDDTTDPATDFQFALAQAAELVVLVNLYADRGDNEEKDDIPRSGLLTPRAVELLSQIRDPSFA